MKTMTEKVIFRMPGDELAAFKRRLSHDGITISVFLRTSIQNYLISNPRITTQSVLPIPFCGCLKDEQGDYRDRAAEYVLGRRT